MISIKKSFQKVSVVDSTEEVIPTPFEKKSQQLNLVTVENIILRNPSEGFEQDTDYAEYMSESQSNIQKINRVKEFEASFISRLPINYQNQDYHHSYSMC